VLVESGGKEDDRAEEHRAAPEGREAPALDLDMLDVLRVFFFRERRDHLVEEDVDHFRLRGVDPHALGGAEEIAGGDIPHLAFAAVHGKLDGMAVRAVEGFILMEKRLDEVIAGRDLGDRIDREAEDFGVENRFFSGFQALDVNPEDRRSVIVAGADLESGLARVAIRDDQEHSSVERAGPELFRIRNADPEPGARAGRRRFRPAGDAGYQSGKRNRSGRERMDACRNSGERS
jgi:hypothetical protein